MNSSHECSRSGFTRRFTAEGRSNILPAIATPRSRDLAHLRTALWFHAADPIERFVTIDEAQAEAAKELGLPV